MFCWQPYDVGMSETSVMPSSEEPAGDDLPVNASGRIAAWPYAHSMEELDRCWDAYMEAIITEGHPLWHTFIPLAKAGVQPYVLSQIFDLSLTVADRLFDEALTDIVRGGPPGTVG